MRYTQTANGYTLRLSARDTHDWASGNAAGIDKVTRWPCSRTSGKRLRVEFAINGDIVDLAVNGRPESRSGDGISSEELRAITSDFLELAVA